MGEVNGPPRRGHPRCARRDCAGGNRRRRGRRPV